MGSTLIVVIALSLLAEFLMLSVTHVNYAKEGGDTGRWLYVSFFGGSGLRKWWTDLNAGPGSAIGPAEYHSQKCGHKFPRHCNSAYCGAFWCGAQKWPIFGWLFVLGHSFRLWCGPSYTRALKNWIVDFKALRNKKRYHGGDCYSWISFR